MLEDTILKLIRVIERLIYILDDNPPTPDRPNIVPIAKNDEDTPLEAKSSQGGEL